MFLVFALVASVAKNIFAQENWDFVTLPAAFIGDICVDILKKPVHGSAVFSLLVLGEAINQLHSALKHK